MTGWPSERAYVLNELLYLFANLETGWRDVSRPNPYDKVKLTIDPMQSFAYYLAVYLSNARCYFLENDT